MTLIVIIVTVFTRKETELVPESEITPYSYELHKLDVFTL